MNRESLTKWQIGNLFYYVLQNQNIYGQNIFLLFKLRIV